MPPLTPTPADVEAAERLRLDLVEAHRNNTEPTLEEARAILARHITLARAEEREACAKELDRVNRQLEAEMDRASEEYAPGLERAHMIVQKAIRARSNA